MKAYNATPRPAQRGEGGRRPGEGLHALLLAMLLVAAPAFAAAKPKTVTLDVKDEDIRVILKSMQKQCGIRNLVIDRDVQGKGTFLFDKVPCRTAFDVVFRTMGLASVDYGNSVVTVGIRHR